MSKSKKEWPKLSGDEIKVHLLNALKDRVDECFRDPEFFNPPADIVRETWLLLAREVPTPPRTCNFFFSDCYNGDEDFEAAVVSLAETGTIVDAQALMSRSLEMFEKAALSYLEDFEVELRAYHALPTDNE